MPKSSLILYAEVHVLNESVDYFYKQTMAAIVQSLFGTTEAKTATESQKGFAAAAAYDAHRPGYPEDALDQLLEALKVAGIEGASVADLAAGTGKFTELLAQRPEAFYIVGIEPHNGMRAELVKKNLKGVHVVDGTAESMPEVPSQSLDALIASQVSSLALLW